MANNKTSTEKPPFYIRRFFLILVSLGLIGGVAALWIPSNTGWLRQSGLSGEAEQKSISDLRLHFLYITGGIIAILTLLQTNWKNQVDRRKVEADIKKNEQDAEKNERDHIRQVHAERRSRYTKAVEQLANEKAAVRLGGIYTLVGLVDEWLADDTLESAEQQKEGQVIINNLCSYIRSPFTPALKAEMLEGDSEPENYEGDFSKDQAAFHEEQDVRRTVFVEMSKRSSTFTKNDKGEIFETVPGIWSDFDFDFSRAPIFYPLNAITIEKGNFSSAKFYSNANFNGATFTQNAGFGEAAFTQTADFSKATFSSSSPKFVETSEVLGMPFRAHFAALAKNQEAHNFTVSKGSFRIPPGEAELRDGVKHHIPVGTVLFDPSSGETSEPAKPLENSDTEEEKPAK